MWMNCRRVPEIGEILHEATGGWYVVLDVDFNNDAGACRILARPLLVHLMMTP